MELCVFESCRKIRECLLKLISPQTIFSGFIKCLRLSIAEKIIESIFDGCELATSFHHSTFRFHLPVLRGINYIKHRTVINRCRYIEVKNSLNSQRKAEIFQFKIDSFHQRLEMLNKNR